MFLFIYLLFFYLRGRETEISQSSVPERTRLVLAGTQLLESQPAASQCIGNSYNQGQSQNANSGTPMCEAGTPNAVFTTAPMSAVCVCVCLFIYLRNIEGEKPTHRKSSYLLVLSPNGHQQPERGPAEAWSPEPHPGLPHKWQEPKYLDCMCCFPKHSGKEQKQI